MAMKPTANTVRKSSSNKPKASPKSRATSSESASLSVTDGNMKSVIRGAFLRRNT